MGLLFWPMIIGVRDNQILVDSLLEQELKEINWLLSRFHKSHSIWIVLFGGSSASAVALPVILFVHWLGNSGSIVEGAVLGGSFITLGLIIGFWWRFHRENLFKEIRDRCLKLQRAGYKVYKKSVFLTDQLDATLEPVGDNVSVMDFSNIDSRKLRDTMI